MVLCCGEALIDFLKPSSSDGCFRASPGGSPYNTAIAIARLGVPTGFFSRISTDMFGEQLAEHLRQNDVDLTYLLRSSDPSTLAFVDKSSGEARYAFFAKGSADRSLRPEDLPGSLPSTVEALMLGSLATVLEPVADALQALVRREHGSRLISFDPNIRETMIHDRQRYLERFLDIARHSHIVKASDQDLGWIFPTSSLEEAASSLLARGPELVLVTLGSKGSMAFTTNDTVAVEAPEVEIVDTVGAGDTFHGAAVAWLSKHDALAPDSPGHLDEGALEELLTFATDAATVTCTRSGADPPRMEDLA